MMMMVVMVMTVVTMMMMVLLWLPAYQPNKEMESRWCADVVGIHCDRENAVPL